MLPDEVTDMNQVSLRERVGKTTVRNLISGIERSMVCPAKWNTKLRFDSFRRLYFSKTLKIKLTGETVGAIYREYGPDISEDSTESQLYKELGHLVNLGLISLVFGPTHDKKDTLVFSTLVTVGSPTKRLMTDRLRTLPDGLLHSDGVISLLEKGVQLGYPVLDCDNIPFDIVYSSPMKSANK